MSQNGLAENPRLRVLLLEDDEGMRKAIAYQLETYFGDTCELKETGLLAEAGPLLDWCQIAVLDMKLPDGTAHILLEGLKINKERVPVIVISAYPELKDAVMDRNDMEIYWLDKPFSLESFLTVFREAMATARLFEATENASRRIERWLDTERVRLGLTR